MHHMHMAMETAVGDIPQEWTGCCLELAFFALPDCHESPHAESAQCNRVNASYHDWHSSAQMTGHP